MAAGCGRLGPGGSRRWAPVAAASACCCLGLLGLFHIPLPAGVELHAAKLLPPPPLGGTAGWAAWVNQPPVAPSVGEPRPIPRLLHQTWKTNVPPAELVPYIESWRVHNPGWGYKMWNDTAALSFLEEEYPWFHKHIENFKSGVEKADILRYFILYHFGGVYADLDMECLRPWEPLLARHDRSMQCALGAEPHAHAKKQGERNLLLCNALMISAPKHPFWEAVFNALLDKVPQVKADAAYGAWSSPVDTTGACACNERSSVLGLDGLVPSLVYQMRSPSQGRSCCLRSGRLTRQRSLTWW